MVVSKRECLKTTPRWELIILEIPGSPNTTAAKLTNYVQEADHKINGNSLIEYLIVLQKDFEFILGIFWAPLGATIERE